jgi:hypothetical protein
MNNRFFQSALLVVLLTICFGGWQAWSFYNGDYKKQQRRIRDLKAELVKVKEARRIWEEALKRGRGQANYNVRFNFFTEQGINIRETGPIVLKLITPWFENHKLNFVKLDSTPVIKAHNMDRYGFTIYGFGAFKAIDETMRWLEEDMRAVITGFRISSQEPDKEIKYKKAPNPSELYFRISWYWLEGAPDRLHSIITLDEDIPVLKRNPFKPYRPVAKVEKKNSTPAGIIWRPAPDTLELQGIMSVGGKFKALINGRYIAVGQTINGYQVLAIRSSEVVVARGNIRSRLALKVFH